MTKKQKLELPWIGKDARPKLKRTLLAAGNLKRLK